MHLIKFHFIFICSYYKVERSLNVTNNMWYLFVSSLIMLCQLYIYNKLFYLHIGGLLFMIMWWYTDDGLVVFTYRIYIYSTILVGYHNVFPINIA